MKTINFISGNMEKLGEIRAILGNTVDVQNQKLEIPEIQGSIREVALAKCRAAAEAVSSGCLRFGRYYYSQGYSRLEYIMRPRNV